MINTFVKPILVLTAICLVVSGALAYVSSITTPIINAADSERAYIAMNEKIPNATGFETINLADYNDMPKTIKQAYRTSNDVGNIFIAAINGFSGDITIICAINSTGEIMAVSTLSHTETQGIGTIIEQEPFLDTFKGIDQNLAGVDTVTGATVTTRAFIHAVEDVMTAFWIINN
ncbi:MAG: FMN-binding protein [Oscillospiraceae bacterium]|jgi:electron transport complex protein RnfG|nr:FMN-binding protein [Oscillospiraceae bacterium]